MPSVAEILAQMLDTPAETEKTAQPADVQETKVDDNEKLAAEYGCTAEDVAELNAELDQEEAHEEAEKQAEEATFLGRFMARGFMDELQKIGMGVGGSEPTTTDQGGDVPQDGSVANRVAQTLSVTHGQKQTPKKDELKAALKAQRANFQVADNKAVEPAPALETESK